MNIIPWYVALMRLVVPLFILRFPLWGIIASIFTDGIDWNLIGIKSKEMDIVYQKWDKAMDSYTYLFVLWIVLQWKDKWAKKIAIVLFGWRIIGEVIFIFTGWRKVFFFFPNVFENFVIVCLIIFWRTKSKKINLDVKQKTVMLIILIIPKMIQEYFQHVLVKQPWEIYSLGSMTGFLKNPSPNIDTFLWILVLYIIPISVFLLYIGKTQAQHH